MSASSGSSRLRAAAHGVVRGWLRGPHSVRTVGGGGAGAPGWLRPAAWPWAAVTALRNAYWDRVVPVGVPGLRVVSVGNVTVGGTGKTPLAAWVAGALVRAGRRPALLAHPLAADEALLHLRWNPGVPVFTARDRVASARRAAAAGHDAAVLDDGFQHRRIARDVDVVAVAAEDPLSGLRPPLGPYREPLDALARAAAVVVTRRVASAARAREVAERLSAAHPHLHVAAVRLGGGRWTDVHGDPAPKPAGDVLALAGVGRPEVFAETVRAVLDADVELWALADHHAYRPGDLAAARARAGGRAVVVTEKDAVKLASLPDGGEGVYVLAQDLRFERGEDDLRRLVIGPAAEERS